MSVVCLLIVVSLVQRGWDSYIVYLFDKSITTYSGPFSARQLPDKVNTIGQFIFHFSRCCQNVKPAAANWFNYIYQEF